MCFHMAIVRFPNLGNFSKTRAQTRRNTGGPSYPAIFWISGFDLLHFKSNYKCTCTFHILGISNQLHAQILYHVMHRYRAQVIYGNITWGGLTPLRFFFADSAKTGAGAAVYDTTFWASFFTHCVKILAQGHVSQVTRPHYVTRPPKKFEVARKPQFLPDQLQTLQRVWRLRCLKSE